MKLFLNTLKCDLKRTILSKNFCLATIGLVIVTILTMLDELQYMPPGVVNIVYVYLIRQFLEFDIIYLLFAAIPGTILFCSDWDNRFIRFSVMRSSKVRYAISKIIACFVSAVGVVFTAEWLLIAIFSLRYPLFDPNYDFNYGVFSSFASSEKITLYYMVIILCKAFCAGFLCVFALWFSTKIINVFVALTTPLIAFYLISNISTALNIPSFLHIANMAAGYVEIENNPLPSFLFPIAVFVAAAAIMGFFFVRNCSRRLENG